MDKVTKARYLRRAIQLWAASLNDDSVMQEVAGVYPEWKAGVDYKAGDVVVFGVNQDQEPQLYRVLKAHLSADGAEPDKKDKLFSTVGFTADGMPIWTKPLGDFDSYEEGDVVSHNGSMWTSVCDHNIWEPGANGWERQD